MESRILPGITSMVLSTSRGIVESRSDALDGVEFLVESFGKKSTLLNLLKARGPDFAIGINRSLNEAPFVKRTH